MNINEGIGRTAKQLGLDLATIEPERRALLPLIRAGAELCRQLTDGPALDRARRTLGEYIDAVGSTAKDAAQVLVDSTLPLRDPQWIRFCLADEYFRASAPGFLVSTGLLVMLPPGHSSLRDAWAYLAQVTNSLLVDEQDYADMRGWLFGSAAPEIEARVIKALDDLRARGQSFGRIIPLIHEARRTWDAKAGHTGARRDFESLRAALRWHLAALSSDGRELGLRSCGAIDQLEQRALHDRFRLAVVGDFNRGKSSLINALIDLPGLMVTSDLPSTSAITSVRDGDRRYERRVATSPERWETRTEEEFRDRSSRADREWSPDPRESSVVGTTGERWRVSYPIPFLAESFVELIDTPGMNDVEERTRLAREEAGISDGAILVVHALQPFTDTELDAAEILRGRQGNIAIAVTFADQCQNQERIREHILKRLASRGINIAPERVVFVSPGDVEPSRARVRTESMSALRDVLKRQVLGHAIERKRRSLADDIDVLLPKIQEDADEAKAIRERQIQGLRERQSRHDDAEALLRAARSEIDAASRLIEESSGPRATFVNGFIAALPTILEAVKAKKATWTASAPPLISPKVHITEVAEKMTADLQREIQQWTMGHGAEVLQAQMASRIDEACEQMVETRRYLEQVGRVTPDEWASWLVKLKMNALQDAFALEVSPGDIAKVMAKAAPLVGVIYYVSWVFVGSWNPIPLLVVAVLGGVGLYLIKGDKWVRSWVQSQVFEKIEENFRKQETVEMLSRGISLELEKVFTTLARSFEREASTLLDNAAYQAKRTEEEATKYQQQFGTEERLRLQLETVTNMHRRVGLQLISLRDVSSRLRDQPTGFPLPSAPV